MTEEKLIELAKAGDMPALEQLIDNYKRLAVSVACTYFLKGGDVLDLVSEGMLGIFKAVKGYDASKNVPFGAFVKLCVTRQIQSAVKIANRKTFPTTSIEEAEKINVVNPEDIVIQQEEYETLQDKIDNILTPLEKNVLVEYLDGASYEEISKKLGISQKSVDNALSRLKSKLKKQ